MKKIIKLSFSLITLFPVTEWSCEDVLRSAFSTTNQHGSQFGLFIPHDEIARTESWLPEEGSPPLSVPDAHKLAVEWFRDNYPQYTEVDTSRISLIRHECSGIADRWYYLFELYPTVNGNYRFFGEDLVAVLMDGTVVGMREY